MELSENYLADIHFYLLGLKKMLPKLPLEKKMYKEGTTVGQILFHTTQAVNYWFRVVILQKEYKRNRALEFTQQPTKKDIEISLKNALQICNALPTYKLMLDEKIEKPVSVEPANFLIETVNAVLLHMTTHTAEHWGELHLLVDK